MSKTRRALRHEQTPVGSAGRGGDNWQGQTNRCKATHDVPYTQRCVLDFDHTAEWADLMGVDATPHRDNAGCEW